MAYDSTNEQYHPAADITDMATAGTSTVAQIEAKLNEILAALRAAGIIGGS